MICRDSIISRPTRQLAAACSQFCGQFWSTRVSTSIEQTVLRILLPTLHFDLFRTENNHSILVLRVFALLQGVNSSQLFVLGDGLFSHDDCLTLAMDRRKGVGKTVMMKKSTFSYVLGWRCGYYLYFIMAPAWGARLMWRWPSTPWGVSNPGSQLPKDGFKVCYRRDDFLDRALVRL